MGELRSKIGEALISALPITLIVYILSLLPGFDFSGTELITFTLSAVFLVLGIGLFNLGADLAMTPMGTHVGAGLSRQRKLWLLLGVCFVLGMLITVAEPDLQVLANQVSSVMDGTLLILAVGMGVGAFLMVAILRIVFKRRLSNILMLFYMLLFALALLLAVNGQLDLLPMAFDSGGVTTGPITVPFIMALGVGISGVLGDRHSRENSFGLVALCSIGPILAVLLLGISSTGKVLPYQDPAYVVDNKIAAAFLHTAWHTAKNVALALGLILAFFLICQFLFLKLPKRQLKRIGTGVVFTYIGLVIFLTAVEVGFTPIGYKLGSAIGQNNPQWLIPLGLAMGILVVLAEPAIHVLNALYKEMGMDKKAQGIAFCLPVSDVAGLVKLPEETEE